MVQLNFSYDEATQLYVAEFTPSASGVLFINRESAGQLIINGSVEGVEPCVLYADQSAKNQAVQINVTGILIRIESATEVTNAVFSGE